MMSKVSSRHRFYGVLQHAISPHAVHRHSRIDTDTDAECPERGLAIERFYVEKSSADIRNPAIGYLDKRHRPQHCHRASQAYSVAKRVDGPKGGAQDGVLQVWPNRPKRIHP